MITRKVPSLHVCLRCRTALAKRSAPTSTPQLRYASNRSSSRNYSPSTKEELEGDNYRNRSNRRESRFAGDSVDTKPFGKLYGHHGHARRAALEDLETKSLNDPAKAIVLRDTIFNFYTYDKIALKPQLAEHIDIEQQLNEERGLVGQDEVYENISTFKPKPGQEPSSWDDINSLVRHLQSGFTTPQLEKYIELYKENAANKDETKWEESIRGSRIMRITPWLPGISELEHTFDADPLRGYFLDSHTNKQRIVLRLLRDCWSVELPELADGIGQFEIEVKQNDLDLLLLGTPSALHAICSQDLTFENEKMEVFRPRNVLRITTLRDKRRWIINQIKEALSVVFRDTIDLEQIVSSGSVGNCHNNLLIQQIDKPMLDELGRLTRCSIVRKDRRFIEVSYLGREYSSVRTSRMDGVKRLLVASIRAPNRFQTQLAHIASKTSDTAFVKCGPSLTSSLPWFDRHRGWSRWSSPIPTSKHLESALPHTVPTESPVDFEAPAPIPSISSTAISKKPFSTESGHIWARRYFTETSALIGSILHEEKGSGGESSWAPQKNREPADDGYTFSTKTPNLSRFLSRGNVHKRHNGRVSHILALRFVPNPFFMPKNPRINKRSKEPLSLGPQAFSAFPAVEMRFNVDTRTKATKLKDIRAVVNETRTDIMIPENLVDTRFQQLTISRLRRRYLKQVRKYLKMSNLSVVDGTMEPMPTINFPISDHLVQYPGTKILGTSLDSEVEDREVEYLFAGLEIRSSMEYKWMGWRLYYTSIKAGRASGSRSELRLLPIRNDERATEDEFVKCAYLLADLMATGSPSAAADVVRRPRKPNRVPSTGPDLIRNVGTEKGNIRENFEYFVKRMNITTIPKKRNGTRLDDEADAQSRSNVLDYEEDEGDIEDHEGDIEDHESDIEDHEIDLVELSHGQQLEIEVDGHTYSPREEEHGDFPFNDTAERGMDEVTQSSSDVRAGTEEPMKQKVEGDTQAEKAAEHDTEEKIEHLKEIKQQVTGGGWQGEGTEGEIKTDSSR